MKRPRIAVVGAGISGLQTANLLLGSPYKPRVTLLSDDFSPNTTTDLSAGVAWPAVAGNLGSTDPRQQRWVANTYEYLFALAGSPLAGRLKVSLLPLYELFDGKREDPFWKDTVLGFRHIGAAEMKTLHLPTDKSCWYFTSVVMSAKLFLAWQMEQFVANGGKVICKKLKNLQEIDGQYDIIVNCSGLGSRELVNDAEVYAVRGQTVTVKAPWMKHGFSYIDHINNIVTNFIPVADGVCLGGTTDVGNWSKHIDPLISKGIMERVYKYFPSLSSAPVIKEEVGLRPGRKMVRLELDDTIAKHSIVIHNYGHQGQGITFFRGCALDVVSIAEDYLLRSGFIANTAQSSKLTLSDAVGDLKTKIGDVELLCTGDDFDVFQKSDAMCMTAQDLLAQECDHHPQVSDGAMLNFDDQSTLVSNIMAYGSIQTAPGRLRDLKVTVKDENRTSLLTWKKPKDGGKPDTYKVEYSADDRKFKPVHSGPELYCQLHGSLSREFSHKYRVAAENRAGCGPFSPPLTIKTKDASFYWDSTRKSPCIALTNDNLTAAVGDHMTGFVSVGGSRIFTAGQHYWEISLDRFGFQNSFRKVIAGVVSADAAEWERSHAFISMRCCPLCKQFWAIACGTGKKLSHQTSRRGSTYLRGDHFSEHDRLGILLDLDKHTLGFYRNGSSIGLAFDDVVGPVIPMVSMRFQKTVTLNFPPIPEVTSDYIVITKTT